MSEEITDGQKGEVNISGLLAGQRPQTRHVRDLIRPPLSLKTQNGSGFDRIDPGLFGISGREALAPIITIYCPPKARERPSPGDSFL